MQAPTHPLTTRHHRQRLALWALALLMWVASVLFAGREIGARQLRQRCARISIDGLTRMVVHLIVIRAGELTRLRRRRRVRFFKYGRDLRRPHFMRSILGSRLRRMLKRKDIAARIAALIHALRNVDACAAVLARRFTRGITRLWPATRRPAPVAALGAEPPLSPAIADSS